MPPASADSPSAANGHLEPAAPQPPQSPSPGDSRSPSPGASRSPSPGGPRSPSLRPAAASGTGRVPASPTAIMASASAGALAGMVATAPMTVVMLLLQRGLPPGDRLPSAQEPLLITRALLRAAGVADDLSESQTRRLTWCAHFGYGTACGVGYGLLQRRSRVPAAAAARGALYGLLVWTLSYAGWLPAMRILPPPTQRPRGRNALLIAAHLVWGISAGVAHARLTRRVAAHHEVARWH